MKKVYLFIWIVLFSLSAGAQGWVGNASNNSMIAVNSALRLNPLSVGIGTRMPTEQFHTTAGVRFQGLRRNDSLMRFLVADQTGKLFWRDASTIVQGGRFWSMTGNAGTIPGTAAGQHFLGTTDAKR